jgi:hypothetical protein
MSRRTRSAVVKDPNNAPVAAYAGVPPFVAQKDITFAGGTTNAIGDHDGTGDPFTIFEVTGQVVMKCFAVVVTDLVGAATLEVGVAGNTAALIPQVADASGMDVDEIWHDATVDAKVELSSVLTEKLVSNKDVIGTVGTANITAGVLRVFALWYPLSADGDVVAAA